MTILALIALILTFSIFATVSDRKRRAELVKLLADVRVEFERLETYRKIWQRLPPDQREQILAAMKCWSPEDYERMVADNPQKNFPGQ